MAAPGAHCTRSMFTLPTANICLQVYSFPTAKSRDARRRWGAPLTFKLSPPSYPTPVFYFSGMPPQNLATDGGAGVGSSPLASRALYFALGTVGADGEPLRSVTRYQE